MLGRLFSSSGEPANCRPDSALQTDESSRAFMDENNTKNLLYGQSSSLRSDVTLDVDLVKDIRVVVVTDISNTDYYIYDSFSHLETGTRHASHYRSYSTSTPFHRRSASSSAGSSSPYLGSSLGGTSHSSLTVHQLKDILFGSTPIKFDSAITKLHPIPSDSPKPTWLVSRLFKINGNADFTERITTFIGNGPPQLPVKSERTTISGQTFAQLVDQTDEPKWNPQTSSSITNPSPTSISTSSANEIRCGICIYFNLAAGSQDILTNHWEELSYALADLQSAIYSRLVDTLLVAWKDYKARKTNNNSTVLYRSSSSSLLNNNLANGFSYTLHGDNAIRYSIDYFKSRFLGAIKIPRVLVGQNRWQELLTEVQWAYTRFGEEIVVQGKDRDVITLFISTMIASFVRNNESLIKRTHHLHCGPSGNPPTRTIIVCSNRIPSRRLIFLLSSLLFDKSTERLNEQLEQVSQLFNNDLLHDTDDDEDSPEDSESHKSPKIPSTGSSPFSKSSAVFSTSERGWEILTGSVKSPTTTQATEIVSIPHVIRPSFSSTSLAEHLNNSHGSSGRSRYPSLDGLRKSMISSSSSSNNSSSIFFPSLWQTKPQSSTPSIDESEEGYFEDQSAMSSFDNYSELSTSLPIHRSGSSGLKTPKSRPSLSRWHSSERTATTVSPNMSMLFQNSSTNSSVFEHTTPRSAHSDFDQTSPLSLSRTDASSSKLQITFSTEEGDDNVVNVDPISSSQIDDSESDDLPSYHKFGIRPIILPTIAGYIPDFHPDFGLQACPLSRDLEDKIARAMTRDGDMIAVPSWARKKSASQLNETSVTDLSLSSFEIVSRCLIVNVKNLEIYEWVLTRTYNENGCSQLLSRSKIFASKPLREYQSLALKVHRKLAEVSSESGDIEGLRKLYESAFNLL